MLLLPHTQHTQIHTQAFREEVVSKQVARYGVAIMGTCPVGAEGVYPAAAALFEVPEARPGRLLLLDGYKGVRDILTTGTGRHCVVLCFTCGGRGAVPHPWPHCCLLPGL
jgi:hypothetical protein